MYPNSLWIVRFIVRIYLFVTGLCILIFRHSFWPVHVPSHLAVRPIGGTKKADYESEHLDYRTLHTMAMQGIELKKWYYFYYRTIALKYNWPYVKELYDNLPDPAPAKAGHLPASPPPTSRLSVWIETLAGRCLKYAKAVGLWRLNAALCVTILAITFVGQSTPNKGRLYDFASNALVCLILQAIILPFYLARKRRATKALTAAKHF